ncbi:unnamed protein product [Chironomus riparius]|uniref:C3H1-type domain-containing protein n=1 Tax=Chironomus riparius TaxID=315576 RepID=A0A9N9RJU6_9DIPT|nr:unnamed protein product [Chironomus riparius]
MEQQPKSTMIFINPKFKNAYINPNFLKSNSNTIHVNPKFLQHMNAQQSLQQQQTQAINIAQSKPIVPVLNSNAIIKNTKRSLIRAPAKIDSKIAQGQKSVPVNYAKKMNLIKISNTKLVNASHLMKEQQKENEKIKKATESIIKTKKLMKKSEAEQSIYKLDRTKSSPGLGKKKKRIVSTYSVRRVDSAEKLTPKKVLVTGHKLLKSDNSSSRSSSKNKKMLMVNINGVLYRSTNNKLEKNSISPKKKAPATTSNEKLLIIRGQKFVLDSSGTKLKRDGENVDKNLSRIDIGGLTYKKKASNGSYEIDNSHQVRNHLTMAKTKSITLLQRVKVTNMICPVYRRLGKCLAYANGRCSKVHDPRYVIVCPNFIKGSCKHEKCLLSHNVNLHKMPVCKYYLKGQCLKTKENCLYLHKKLTDGTKLCVEFVKGYCPLADKCNLLHDFPENGSKKYSYVRKSKAESGKKKEVPAPSNTPITPQPTTDARYFEESSSSSQVIQNIPKLTKTAPSLPDFIKI